MSEHKITIIPAPRKHMLERQPRYDVLVNGEKRGELYFNMTGYVGGLPMVQGGVMNIGERAISAWRKEAALLNREAVAAIAAGSTDIRRISLTRPTSDNRMLMAISKVDETSAEIHLISRREFISAKKMFGTEAVGLGFFGETRFSGNPDEDPQVLLREGDSWMTPLMTGIRHRVMHSLEAEQHVRRVEHVFATSDPETRLVIGRRVVDDVDPEPCFVTRQSLEFAKHVLGDELRIGDLTQTDPVRIEDPEVLAYMRREFTWFDPECPADASAQDMADRGSPDGPGL